MALMAAGDLPKGVGWVSPWAYSCGLTWPARPVSRYVGSPVMSSHLVSRWIRRRCWDLVSRRVWAAASWFFLRSRRIMGMLLFGGVGCWPVCWSSRASCDMLGESSMGETLRCWLDVLKQRHMVSPGLALIHYAKPTWGRNKKARVKDCVGRRLDSRVTTSVQVRRARGRNVRDGGGIGITGSHVCEVGRDGGGVGVAVERVDGGSRPPGAGGVAAVVFDASETRGRKQFVEIAAGARNVSQCCL